MFGEDVFKYTEETIYYLSNTTGWKDMVAGRPAIMKKLSNQ